MGLYENTETTLALSGEWFLLLLKIFPVGPFFLHIQNDLDSQTRLGTHRHPNLDRVAPECNRTPVNQQLLHFVDMMNV